MPKRNQWKQREKELETEVLQLRGEVEYLTIEINRLEKILEAHNTENTTIPKYHQSPSQDAKVCHCKAQCATRHCGCVKRHTLCSKLCECSTACKNKKKKDEEQNKENLENIEVAHVEAKQTSNKNFINVTHRRGLFSPNTTMVSSPVQFKRSTQWLKSDSEEGTPKQLTRTIEDQGRVLQKEKHNQILEDSFDPMEPKHQLARTPPKDKKLVHSHTGSSSLILTPNFIQEKEEEQQIPEEFEQPEVDWEKYQAQLVPCNKCKRKFHPNRVIKHQKCCKKV